MAGRRCAGAKMGLIKTGEWSEIDPTFPGGATEADGAYFVLDTPGQLNLFQWNSRRPDCGNGPLRLMLTVESWDSLLDAAKSAQQKSAGQQSHRHSGHWSMNNLNENRTRDDHWTHISLKTATTSIPGSNFIHSTSVGQDCAIGSSKIRSNVVLTKGYSLKKNSGKNPKKS